jgi:excisionase family DNA binding protein
METVTKSALLKKSEAAQYLNVSERWLQRNAHKITHIKMGKSMMFLIPDLDAYIQRNRKAAVI